MLTLDAVKLYCKLDDCASPDEDAQIEGLIDAAKEYLAGVNDIGSARYELAIKALVLHWYSGEPDMSPALHLLINQLKFSSFGEVTT